MTNITMASIPHLVAIWFMQVADAGSLRDISNGLRSATGNLCHLGIAKAPCKSSHSYQNKVRKYEVFRDLYFALLERLEPSLQRRRLYANRLKRKVFIMDASIIPLCLSLFDWARFRTTKGGIKLHTVVDYDTGLPCYSVITEAKKHEIQVARPLVFPSGSVVVVDRGYVDYAWLFNLDSCGVTFVTRLKSNADIAVAESFLTDSRREHILSDEDVVLAGYSSKKAYPKPLRVVKVQDSVHDQTLYLLTNQMSWTADTISQLYKARWDV